MAARPKPATWIGFNSVSGIGVRRVLSRGAPEPWGGLSWRRLTPDEADATRAVPQRFLYHEPALIARPEVQFVGGGAVLDVGGDPGGVRIVGLPPGVRARIAVNGIEAELTSDAGAEDNLILIRPESAGIIAVRLIDDRFWIAENPIYLTAREPS